MATAERENLAHAVRLQGIGDPVTAVRDGAWGRIHGIVAACAGAAAGAPGVFKEDTMTGSAPGFAIVAVLLVALGACNVRSDADFETEALADAAAAVARKDTAAAVLTLKEHLQRQPESAAARLALGQLLLEQGEADAAQIELAKAESLGMEPARVVPLRARALLASGKAAEVIERYRGLALADPRASADLHISVAIAAAATGATELAQSQLADAARGGPDLPRATLLRARLELAAGQPQAALARLQAATTATGTEAADIQVLAGEILQARLQRGDDALAAFKRALQADPTHAAAHRALVLLQLARGDTDGARSQIEALERAQPHSTAARILRAMLDFERQDYAGARAKLQPLLAASPANPVLLELAGATEFKLGALDAAETLLRTALERNPHLPLARPTLAQLYLQRGQAELVLETLAPLLAQAPAPAAVAAMAGQAQLLLGHAAQAEKLFAAGGDEAARVRVQLARLAQGQEAPALAELQTLAGSSRSALADTALIGHFMRKQDWPRALAAIDALERKQPERPAAALLRGRVLGARQDLAGARASYEAALKISPQLLPALQGLAALDIAEGQTAQARQRLQPLAAKNPGDAHVQLALVDILERTGAQADEVTAQLGQAVAASPGSVPLRLQLINALLKNGQTASAKTAAAAAVAAVPGNTELLHAKGRAALAAGENEQAVTLFTELAQRLPKSPQLQLDLASARLAQGELAGAERHLRQALALAPDMALAQETLVSTLLQRGRADDALAFARTVQGRSPTGAAGFFLEGRVQSAGGHAEAALAAYRRALQLEPSGRAALHLHAAFMAAGQGDAADRHARSWAAAHPDQLDFASYLADQAAMRGNLAGAEAAYRELLRRAPAHAVGLNNLAWLLARQGKPGALALAERARAAAPYSAAVQDTLALALEAEGQVGRAAEVQARLVERVPGNPDYRLHLAHLLVKTGDKNKARGELQALAKLGDRYPRQREVAALQAQL